MRQVPEASDARELAKATLPDLNYALTCGVLRNGWCRQLACQMEYPFADTTGLEDCRMFERTNRGWRRIQ